MNTAPRWDRDDSSIPEHITDLPYPAFFLHLLASRGLSSAEDIKHFLHPDYERDTHDPLRMKDMEQAVARIWQAVEQGEKILIYGDYDADGISASAVLAEFFRGVEYEHGIYMPDRTREGHGLNMEAVEGFVKDGVELLITVDCGATNTEAVARAQEAGVDVIITDHHRLGEERPPAYALVNPHQEGDEYPFKHLCGAGVAFKLFQALARDPRAGERWQNGKEKWLLDLVALGTVADMVPLVGENRALVKYGLFVLAQTRRPGLQELFRVSGITPTFDRDTIQTNINAITIGFSLGPRINAASRMAHAALGYDLLTAEDAKRARLLALELEENNKKRKKEIETVSKQVMEHVDIENPPPFVVLSSPHWPIPILGLIANKIKDATARPVLLGQEQGEETKVSLRAPDGFNVLPALKQAENLLTEFGGHPQAAGGVLPTENISKLRNILQEHATEILKKDPPVPSLRIDAEVTLSDITLENAELVEQLAPFGMKNPAPVLALKDVQLDAVRMLGKRNNHAKLFISDSKRSRVPALMFFHNGDAETLETGARYDVAGELSVNEWNGRREAQLKIVDIRPHSNTT